MATAAQALWRAPLLTELLAYHARFPSLFEANAEPKLLFDLAGNLAAANPAALKLLGRRINVMRGDRFARGFSRYMGPFEREAFALAIAGRTARVATTIAKPDGHLIAVEASLFPAVVDDTTVGVYVSAVDVTSRIERERATARRIQELSSLFENHAHSTMSVDALGRVRSVNSALERMLGYSAEELVGRPYASVIFGDAVAAAAKMFERAMSGQTMAGTMSIRHKAGDRIEFSGVLIPIVVDDHVVGAYAVGDDRTQAQGANERIRELYLLAANPAHGSEAQLAMALDTGRRRLGCAEAYIGRIDGDAFTFVHCTGLAKHREGERVALFGTLDECAMQAGEPVALTGDDGLPAIAAPIVVAGQPFGTVAFIAPRRGLFDSEDVDYVRLVSSLASASIDRGQQHRRLDALAFYDALTGLPNRVQLADRLTEAIARAERDRLAFALHFFDLDGFKAINDEHGHPRGDDVIALIGKRFERHVARPNIVARVGGDEFVVVQPSIRERADAAAFAEILREAIAEPFVVERCEYRISASVGIALYPRDGTDAATLLARADLALYKVKATGRDAVAFVEDID